MILQTVQRPLSTRFNENIDNSLVNLVNQPRQLPEANWVFGRCYMHSYTSTSFFFGIICKLIRWFNCERVLIICLYYKYELAYKSACRACVFKVCEPPKGELILQIELVQFQTCTRSAIHLLLASMACYSMICAFNIIIGVYGVSEYTARLSNVFIWRKKKCILIRISKRHYLIFVIRVYPSSYT